MIDTRTAICNIIIEDYTGKDRQLAARLACGGEMLRSRANGCEYRDLLIIRPDRRQRKFSKYNGICRSLSSLLQLLVHSASRLAHP